jgi:C4-dicarboxylate transporter, DctQ subunit
MRVLHRALDRLEDAFAVLAGVLLILTVIFVSIDVASRYFFNAPLTWVYEVTEYVLLLVPCLGMGWLARSNGHIAIDIVTSRLPDGSKRLVNFACSLTVAAICAFIAWWGGVVTLESFKAKAIIENVLQTPQWAIYVAIPAGFGICAIEFARKAFAPGSPDESLERVSR